MRWIRNPRRGLLVNRQSPAIVRLGGAGVNVAQGQGSGAAIRSPSQSMEPVRWPEQAARYCAKYMVKDEGAELVFSDNFGRERQGVLF